MVETKHRFAIVGAGISGMAIALALSRNGFVVTVYERFAEPSPIGSGLLLQPTGLAVLEALGLREHIEPQGSRITALEGKTDTGRRIFNLDFHDVDPSFHAVGIHRSTLHDSLWNAVRDAGISVVSNIRVVDTQRRVNGPMVLLDEAGDAIAETDIVIDASGAQSALIRRRPDFRTRPFTYGAVWATVKDIGVSKGMLAQRYRKAHKMMGYLPCGHVVDQRGTWATLFWSLKPENHREWMDNFAQWRLDATALWPALTPVVEGIDTPERFTLARYTHHTVHSPFGDGIVHIGDAAHATSPQLGQGANNGLLDASCLANSLVTNATADAAFRAYARSRWAHVRFYQLASYWLTPLFQSDSQVAAGLRDVLLRPLSRSPLIRREMIRTLAGLKAGPLTTRSPQALMS